jgi:hypothetical protein
MVCLAQVTFFTNLYVFVIMTLMGGGSGHIAGNVIAHGTMNHTTRDPDAMQVHVQVQASSKSKLKSSRLNLQAPSPKPQALNPKP